MNMTEKTARKLIFAVSALIIISSTIATVYLFVVPAYVKWRDGNSKSAALPEKIDYIDNYKYYDPEVSGAEVPESTPEQADPSPRVLLPEITQLREEYSNDDIVAFLEIADTNISYPVTQTTDNEYYLDRDIHGNPDISGTIFVDYENSMETFSDNTVIYGHNMRDGSMFHNLRNYFEEDYYKAHPYISLVTLYEQTVWEIFAFCKTTTDFYYIQTDFEDEESFLGLLLQMKMKSRYDTGISVSKTDKILTLSTCANEGGENRYILCAKLIEANRNPNSE